MKSVGGSSPPEASVYSVQSVGEYPPPEISVNSVNSVGGLAQTNLEWVLWKEFGGRRGYGRDAIPSYENSHGLHRCAQIRRVWHPCHTHAATKLSSHRIHGTHRNDWRRRKIREHLWNLWGALICQKVLWVLRVPWEILIWSYVGAAETAAPPKDCHATTTRLPRYNNNIATLQQQGCHATAKCRETDVRWAGR